MSRRWDNVVWKNARGQWGYGFFEVTRSGEDPDDDDYDYSKFAFAGTGFLSEDAVYQHIYRNFPNPGSHDQTSDPKEAAEFEDMARAANDPNYARERDERIRKKRALEVRKIIRSRIKEMAPKAGERYTVDFSASGPVTDFTGIFLLGVSGNLAQQGDWLVVESMEATKRGTRKTVTRRVWNTRTQRQAANVAGMRKFVSRWA